MTAYFVTGTGTEVGKTYVVAGIVRAARAAGRATRAIKPVMSGYDGTDPEGSDAGVLLRAMDQPVTAETIAAMSPWRYAAFLSPDMAAARENRQIDFADLVAFCEAAIAATAGLLLIEGAGGAMVPLNGTQNIRSLIATLGLPVIVVSGTYLGTISHTLTTTEALGARGINIAAVVLNESAESPAPPEEIAATIRRFLPFTPVKTIPRRDNDAAFQNLEAQLTNEGRLS